MGMTNDNILHLYSKHYEDGITIKDFANRIGISASRLHQYFNETSHPKPAPPQVVRARKVKEWIINKGGTISLALVGMGYSKKDAGNLAPTVRTLLNEWNFPYRDYAFKSLVVGNYEGGVLVEGYEDLPQGKKRINVRCLNCGHEHDISFSIFSGGRTFTCSHCPRRHSQRRKYKVLETGEVSSLRSLWLRYFKEEVPYVSLRIKVLRHGFYKGKSDDFTLALLDTDEAIVKCFSRAKRGQYQPAPPA